MKAIQFNKLPVTLAVIGVLFLLIGLLFPNLNSLASGFVGNLFGEAVGTFIGSAITIAVIDEITANRDRQLRFSRARLQAEGILIDVAARALLGSANYKPGDIESRSTTFSDIEPWRTIISILGHTNGWALQRLGANEPAPDELGRLSPRVWDIIAVPREDSPGLNIARRTAIVEACADDLEWIADEFVPELIDDLFEARQSSAVITHWVYFLRYNCLQQDNAEAQDHFFPHVAAAIWEVLFLFDKSFHDIPHPLRRDEVVDSTQPRI